MFQPPKPVQKTAFVLLGLLLSLSVNAQQQTSSAPLELPSDSLNTLLFALKRSDMIAFLEDKGAFTVFAPSDAAFRQMEARDMRQLLLPENKQTLKSLMAYHVVAGKLSASKILQALCRGEGSASFTTIQGEELLASMEGTDIILTDCSGNQARITAADTSCRNLVFHQIDHVILPGPLQPLSVKPSEKRVSSR